MFFLHQWRATTNRPQLTGKLNESWALTPNRILPRYRVDYFGSCQNSYGAHIRYQWPLLFGTPGRLVGKRPLDQRRTPCTAVGIPGMGRSHVRIFEAYIVHMNHACISYGTICSTLQTRKHREKHPKRNPPPGGGWGGSFLLFLLFFSFAGLPVWGRNHWWNIGWKIDLFWLWGWKQSNPGRDLNLCSLWADVNR